MKAGSTLSQTHPHCLLCFISKKTFLVFGILLLAFTSLHAQSTCTDPPVPTLTATTTCDGGAFNLVLSSVTPANRAAEGPFDLVINGVTYLNVPLGGAIIPPGSGASEKLFPDADPSPITLITGTDGLPVELGVKFRSQQSGFITAIRFFSPAVPAGTYTGHLWTSSGTLLATATFTGVTGSSWQEVSFSSPVAINGNTTYIASYNSSTGDYVLTPNFFTSPFSNGISLSSPQGAGPGTIGGGIGNGLFSYDASLPDSSFNDGNYWVDVRFTPFPVSQNVFGVANPGAASFDDGAAVELGVKFNSSQDGFIKGVRFFSPTAPLGTYTGHLWTSTGTLLATATFTNVTASSWQEVGFSTPVPVTAGTTYIASYTTDLGRYVATANYFTAPVVAAPITYPQGAGAGTIGGGTGNGLYSYDASPPDSSTNDNNYWVDVNFVPSTYTYNLTSITDATDCANTGALQTLTVTSCSTLPVTLTNISATPKDNAILIQWTTSSEINNLGFELQRSTDGRSWSAITFVSGAGNSTSTINYSYVDEKLSPRRYYYRLKQIDIDQKFVYSATVSAILDGKEIFALEQNYPNPFKNETILRFSLPRKTKINLSLFDMNGRLVKVLVNGSKEAGSHALTFNAGSLGSGIYYYKLQTEDFSSVKKMIIQ